MKKIILLILFYNLGFSSIFDFDYIEKANKSYSKQDYKTSSKYFDMVKDSDEALFNKGDSLYRAKKYKEALDTYKSIKDKSLQFKKLYNMGNCYAHLNKIDDAIKSYEEALKIKDDKDAKFNLDLLKKQKKKQKKKQDKKKKNNKDKKQDKKQGNNHNKDSKKSQQNNKKGNKGNKNKDKEHQKKDESKKAQKAKKVPISDMEERKWQNSLNNRGVNTLMLPIGKGEKNDETKPW